jgi:hypothetical protein
MNLPFHIDLMERFGKAEELLGTLLFLACSEASGSFR